MGLLEAPLNHHNPNNYGGRRIHGYHKKSLKGRPLITVVTVALNNVVSLEKTLSNIIQQTYNNVEYIIIDGGSTDGTLESIKNQQNKIDYWVSEQDEGIYQAMNKGISLSTGEWINFMNAGDHFESDETLSRIFARDWNNYEIIYGDTQINYNDFCKISKAKKISTIWQGMRFSHQSCLIKSAYHKLNPYPLAYPIVGDYGFFYRAYLNRARFGYYPGVIAEIAQGGISETHILDCFRQKHAVVKKYRPKTIYSCYYYIYYVRVFIFLLLKKILPKKLFLWVRKIT